MSDWIDLQLAHSLTPASAPDELWARIERARAPRKPERSPIRWAVPAAIAAAVMVVLAQPVRQERFKLVSANPPKVEHWLAHQPGESGPLRPMPAARAQAVVSDGRSDAACRYCHTL
jgi:hypothetical protein